MFPYDANLGHRIQDRLFPCIGSRSSYGVLTFRYILYKYVLYIGYTLFDVDLSCPHIQSIFFLDTWSKNSYETVTYFHTLGK